MHKTVLM